ncbi:MAG: nicotinate phosphoribosyltransferase [Candidatus Omnitrophica bacterium CG11_big_fil_rev_8_21_14_0_20_45_26]|uniref:nicotinate phosphoribosyltransferase n=1 Tax=Candidatus Abzuiibacterium crystallinum TaxID=1974748 RepID=A0A2H0LQD2_9BACT|nr:MAG: nicotinate phosphoribosyltransferase [Candidatus Omnitrophica bacterium CG11_big_fil_rev_8_21_14_0_20_45_26]PIW63293.1 MAG: nicotinate phosphoribosyltransferase [Candidatus Omnitrophica bacterium CG12_big_fil_rev_8_21_14_0_65_45_16]
MKKQPSRLPPSLFKIPTDKIRSGYYSDRYFTLTQEVLLKDKRETQVGYQFFSRKRGIVCGLDEAIAILKTCAGYYRDMKKSAALYKQLRRVQWQLQQAAFKQNKAQMLRFEKQRTLLRDQLNHLWVSGWKKLKVWALRDGDLINAHEPILAIEGDPRLFVHLETVLLGVIARPTATASRVHEVVKAAGRKPIFFFPARFDHYWVQATDGYAALKAGVFAVSTDANADYWGTKSVGTMPHFLIGCYVGKTDQAFLAFDRHTNPKIRRIALVDWDNDCIGTTRRVIEALVAKRKRGGIVDNKIFKKYAPRVIGAGRGKLWGVRFDTSKSLRDKSVSKKSARGVSPELVRKARQAFNQWGCRGLKIVVSSSFDGQKIRRFEKLKLPVNAYGVGAFLLQNHINITADIVTYEGKPCAKIGRKKSDWSRLERVS